MAIAALNSAATGLKALSTRIDVVANNLANAETTAFKRSRVNFNDLMYVTVREPGSRSASGDVSPAGIQIGLGTRVSNTQLDLEQGSPENTGRQLDVAVQGAGFFRVRVLPSIGDGTAYTRAGNFFVNNNGELVVDIGGGGYRVEPSIVIPQDIVPNSITIGTDGVITVQRSGSVTREEVGRFQLATFVNPNGLKAIGGSLYIQTEASGDPLISDVGENGTGELLQGFLEASNVDPVKELVTLIKTQRAFELNSQSIQTADQALQTIGNLRRF